MLNLPNNISKRERIVRGVIGIVLIVGSLFAGKFFAVLIGLILAAEAALNYCVVVDLIQRFKLDGSNDKNPPNASS